jgi:hypothetical protein
MKRIVLLPLLLTAGLVTGGGAAFAVRLAFGPVAPAAAATVSAEADSDTAFVPAGAVLVPMVAADGGLAGYARIDVQLEVAADAAADVAARLPLLLNAVNLRTYKVPLAAGPGGQLPDLPAFRALVGDAAAEAYGKGIVKRVAITATHPA